MKPSRERIRKNKPKKETPMIPETAIVPVAAPEPLALTAQEIRSNVNLIQQVLKSVFKKDVHYGIIPGTPKPTLYKPGAEKIMVLFRLSGKPNIEDLSTADEIRYRVSILVTHQVTRHEIGWGVGECSSNETKYKWIKIKHPSEWDATPETHRREIWKDGREKPYKIQQVRANISDVANTVLKIAKKRALVDGALTCTAASDVFDQDIEDLPEGLRQNVTNGNRPPMPQRVSQKPASDEPPPPQESAESDIEFGEPPPPPKTQKVDFSNATQLIAKFNAPCKLCSAMLEEKMPILYISDGSAKGRYCTSHAK